MIGLAQTKIINRHVCISDILFNEIHLRHAYLYIYDWLGGLIFSRLSLPKNLSTKYVFVLHY